MKIRPISRSPLRPVLGMFRQASGNPPSRTPMELGGRKQAETLSAPDRRAIDRANNEGMCQSESSDEPTRHG